METLNDSVFLKGFCFFYYEETLIDLCGIETGIETEIFPFDEIVFLMKHTEIERDVRVSGTENDVVIWKIDYEMLYSLVTETNLFVCSDVHLIYIDLETETETYKRER